MVKKLEPGLTTEFTTPPSPNLGSYTVHPRTHTRRQQRMEQAEGAKRMDWKIWLASITGSVDQELLLRNECLVMENRILRNQI